MSPAKIAAVIAGLILALTVGAHQQVTGALRKRQRDEATALVERSAGLFLVQNRLQSLEFTSQTAQYARLEAFPRVFLAADAAARKRAAFDAVNALNADQISKAYEHPAALVAVVDDTGKVLARDLNASSMVGDDLKAKYGAVGLALAGTANKDTWAFNKRMYRVACAPIRGQDGKIAGALIIGFEESGREAGAQRESYGVELALFLENQIYASSFAAAGKESTEEQELGRSLFQGPQFAAPATKSRRQTAPFTLTLPGKGAYVGVAAPLLGNSSQPEAGFVVLTPLEADGAAAQAGLWIIILGGVAAVLGAIGALWTGRLFLGPLEQIEAGMTEILNGNRDYVFEKGSPALEGMENTLNAMVSRLVGRPEPGDESIAQSFDREKAPQFSGPVRSSDGMPVVSGTPASPRLSPENQELAAEPEEQYLRRLFNEYVHAREQTGEGAKDLNYNGFVEKLRESEATLSKKYNSRIVRFKVVIKQGQVTLKPVPLP